MKKGVIIAIVIMIVLLVSAYFAYPYAKLVLDYNKLSKASKRLSEADSYSYLVQINYESNNSDAAINEYSLDSYGSMSNGIIQGTFDVSNMILSISTEDMLIYQMYNDSIFIQSPSLIADTAIEFESRLDNDGVAKLVDIESATDIIVNWDNKRVDLIYDRGKELSDVAVANIKVPQYMVDDYLKEINKKMPTDSFIFSLLATEEFPYDKLDTDKEYPLNMHIAIDNKGDLKLCSMDLNVVGGNVIHCDIFFYDENSVSKENKMADNVIKYSELGMIIKAQAEMIVKSLIEQVWK